MNEIRLEARFLNANLTGVDLTCAVSFFVGPEYREERGADGTVQRSQIASAYLQADGVPMFADRDTWNWINSEKIGGWRQLRRIEHLGNETYRFHI